MKWSRIQYDWGFDGHRWGVAKLVKAPDFDSGIRGFESFLPSHLKARSC